MLAIFIYKTYNYILSIYTMQGNLLFNQLLNMLDEPINLGWNLHTFFMQKTLLTENID